MWCRLLIALACLALPRAALAGPPEPGTLCSSGTWGQVHCIRPAHFAHDTCTALESFAGENDLDPHFFARLIWQESRFDPNALSHASARGIAQFIDGTAKRRGLKDVWNPAEALEFSAHYLGEMVRTYGNEGLAAVGYNGGERRAEGLIAGTGGLARETIDYVRIITGLEAETWRDTPPENHDFRLQGDMPFREACVELAQHRRMTRLAPEVPPPAPFGVQVAHGRSRDAALRAFRARTRACRALAPESELDLVHVRNRASGRRGFVMARLGRDTLGEARSLCGQLKRRGCVCAVFRNG